MFIESKLIDIKIHYRKTGKFQYDVYNSNNFIKAKLEDEEREEFKELNVKMFPLTWGLYNDLQESAMVADNLGNRHFNYKVYKESRLTKLIAEWDATAKNPQTGELEKIKPEARVLRTMAPEIGEIILNTYDEISVMDEDAENF